MSEKKIRTRLVGYCGLYCGLCSKYHSKAPSRCVGCRLGEQHAWCSIWNCCSKKHGFESCAECGEGFHCAIFVRRKVPEWIPAADNLRRIKGIGLKSWLTEQKERQTMLEELLRDYNEGRSMSFYCKACARMPVDLIDRSIKKAKERWAYEKMDKSDLKAKVNLVKAMIKEIALEAGVSLD